MIIGGVYHSPNSNQENNQKLWNTTRTAIERYQMQRKHFNGQRISIGKILTRKHVPLILQMYIM